ncbi:class I SAM-dependent methyltransferase [uncultured Cytophaga sp.]|uniref:class I SAM-dependent methyltransferase n=1 Tax=uncultured Cytophaga sp. TaxID=160238 RepID=UPI002623B875|nr:class I SAM-dependent methyltransferase [uncultured Cytophaga sp.]
MNVSENIKEGYSNQYDTEIIEWRNIGAKYKALNIIELSKSIKFDSVLEVGCGEGSILDWLSKWNFSQNLNGIEISESGIEIIKNKNIKNLKELLLFDGYKIPFPDNSFDLVICSHVLEHVEHERVLLREIMRVSKYQIFEVPIDFSFSVDKKINHFMSYGHINIYTPGLFKFLLKSENFDVIKEKFYLYNDDVLKMMCANKKSEYVKIKFKYVILKLIPYLMRIKPSAFVVLTTKSEKAISIF